MKIQEKAKKGERKRRLSREICEGEITKVVDSSTWIDADSDTGDSEIWNCNSTIFIFSII
jgi:hypothetical protein